MYDCRGQAPRPTDSEAHQVYDVAGIGRGPSGLGLAIAIEERHAAGGPDGRQREVARAPAALRLARRHAAARQDDADLLPPQGPHDVAQPGDDVIDRAWRTDMVGAIATVMCGTGLDEPLPRRPAGGAGVCFIRADRGGLVGVSGSEDARVLEGVIAADVLVAPAAEIDEHALAGAGVDG
jgi:hypothetical protein